MVDTDFEAYDSDFYTSLNKVARLRFKDLVEYGVRNCQVFNNKLKIKISSQSVSFSSIVYSYDSVPCQKFYFDDTFDKMLFSSNFDK